MSVIEWIAVAYIAFVVIGVFVSVWATVVLAWYEHQKEKPNGKQKSS